MNPLLQVNGLKKYFPVKKGLLRKTVGYVKAVDGVDFHINEAETFGLVGESGCGKTTVGKLVLKLINASDGKILFNGKEIVGLTNKEFQPERKNIQLIFQDPYGSLNPRMTVGDLIAEPMRKHHVVEKSEVKQRVAELLEIVGLNPKYARKYPHEFSGGQRQRIGLARALSVNPKLIVCDEPVSALDVSIQAQILNLLKDLQQQLGVAYLFIAHGMAVVKHVSHRVGVMYLGKLMEVADSKTIFEECRHPYTQALMSAVPIPDPAKRRERIILSGEIPSALNPPAGCRFNSRCPLAKDICREAEPVLKEIAGGHLVACHFVQ